MDRFQKGHWPFRNSPIFYLSRVFFAIYYNNTPYLNFACVYNKVSLAHFEISDKTFSTSYTLIKGKLNFKPLLRNETAFTINVAEEL